MTARATSFWNARSLQDLSIRMKLNSILFMLMLDFIIIVFAGVFAVETLSSIRTAVDGQGTWGKSLGSMFYTLGKYASLNRETDFQEYLEARKIPFAYAEANIELNKDSPNAEKIAEIFLRATMHPDDVGSTSELFVRFKQFPHIGRALKVWTKAQALLQKLDDLALKMRDEIGESRLTPERASELLLQINSLKSQINAEEKVFCAELGEASRIVALLFNWLIIIGVSILAIFSFMMVRHVKNNLVIAVDDISSAAKKVAQGDLSVRSSYVSNDELGVLAKNFNFMASELGKLDNLKTEFFSNVSHEIRTPLTLILSPAEALMTNSSGNLESSQIDKIKTIQANGIRLLQLVNGLLDFSKLSSHKYETQLDVIDLHELATSIYNAFIDVMKDKSIRYVLDLANITRRMIYLDRYIFERISFNLLSNALKFTDPGGEIVFTVSTNDSHIQLSVKDTGIGIPLESQKNLFQKFFQVDGASSRRYEGTGLGLALVKEFSELHGGSVSVESTAGVGSKFTVTLAAKDALPNSDLVHPASNQRQYKHLDVVSVKVSDTSRTHSDSAYKILIAEDNPELAAFSRSLLEGEYVVRVAPNGQLALEEAVKWHPDLILSDIMMPVMDGIDLCRKIRQHPEISLTKIILVSALTHRDAVLKGWEAGADDYLFKPFHPLEMMARVRSMVEIQRIKKDFDQKLDEQRSHSLRVSKLATLGELAAGVAHEINNPLAIISASTFRFEKFLTSMENKNVLETLAAIKKAVTRITNIVQSLRKFSGANASKELKEVDLKSIIEEAIQLTSLKANSQGVEIIIDSSVTKDLLIRANEIEMEQVLINLINNSIDAVKHLSQRWVKISAQSSDLGTNLFIRDSGLGIPSHVREKIFEPFFTTKLAGEGTGLGLSISRGILKEFNATIEIVSTDPNTCFKLCFTKLGS